MKNPHNQLACLIRRKASLKQPLALLLLAIAFGVSASEAQAQILYSENFDSYSTGQIHTVGASGGWANENPSTAALVVADPKAPSAPNDLQIGSATDVYTMSSSAAIPTSGLYATFDLTPTFAISPSGGAGDILVTFDEQGYNPEVSFFINQFGTIEYNIGGSYVSTGVTAVQGDELNVTFDMTATTDSMTVKDLTAGTTLINGLAVGESDYGAASSLVLLEIKSDGFGGSTPYASLDNFTLSTSPIPEPTALALVSLSGLGLMWFVQRTRRSTQS